MVRWTREEYEFLLEDEDVQADLALHPRRRRLPANGKRMCTLPDDYKLTDKHGRKSWAMDDVWAQCWGENPPVHQEEATGDKDEDSLKHGGQQTPRTNAANGGKHAADCR